MIRQHWRLKRFIMRSNVNVNVNRYKRVKPIGLRRRSMRKLLWFGCGFGVERVKSACAMDLTSLGLRDRLGYEFATHVAVTRLEIL